MIDEQNLPAWKGSIQHVPILKFSADGKLLYTVRQKQIMEITVGGKFRTLGKKLDNVEPAASPSHRTQRAWLPHTTFSGGPPLSFGFMTSRRTAP